MTMEFAQEIVFDADAQTVSDYIARLPPHPKHDHRRPAITVSDENFTCICEFLIGSRRDALYTFVLSVSVWWGKPEDDIPSVWDKMLTCDDESLAEITLTQKKLGECNVKLYLNSAPLDWRGVPTLSVSSLGNCTRLIVDAWRAMINGWLSRPATLSATGAPQPNGDKPRKRIMWDNTERKVKDLRKYRLDQLKTTGMIPKWTHACKAVEIDPKTAKTHDPKLRSCWDDREFQEI